jgi:HAE1 family hydrophobic/amphiphilic exporter-1
LPSGALVRLEFNEFRQKSQNGSIMKNFSILLVFILTAFSAVAQTDTNAVAVPAETNAPALQPDPNTVAVQTNANAVAAQTGTNMATMLVETNAPAPASGTNAAVVPAGMSALDPVGGAGLHGTNAAAMLVGMNAATRPMSLEDCIQEALQHNLDVQIERTAPQISLYNLRGAYSSYDPLLNASGQHNYDASGRTFQNGITNSAFTSKENSFKSDMGGTLPMGLQYDFSGNVYQQSYTANPAPTAESSGGSIQVQLTQPLLKNFWIDQPRLTIRLAKNQLKSSEQGLRLQVITSVAAVENAYYELIYAQENVKVQQEALVLAQTQLDQDNQRVQIGTLAVLDVQQDEAQVAQSKANLISAISTLGTDQRLLKNLLTDEYSKWFKLDIEPTETITNAPLQLFDVQDSWSKGMTLRPDLLQARLSVEAQGIQLKFDRNQLFPLLDLTGSYGYGGYGGEQYSYAFGQINNGNQPFYSYGAQLSVPLSNIKARNTIKSDKMTLQQLLLKLKQLEQNIMVQIDNAVGVALSDYQGVQASRQARIYAEAALDAEQKKYAVGKSTTFTVLQLQNTLTVDRGLEIRALANYYEALVTLAQQEGSTLERNRIDIEVK